MTMHHTKYSNEQNFKLAQQCWIIHIFQWRSMPQFPWFMLKCKSGPWGRNRQSPLTVTDTEITCRVLGLPYFFQWNQIHTAHSLLLASALSLLPCNLQLHEYIFTRPVRFSPITSNVTQIKIMINKAIFLDTLQCPNTLQPQHFENWTCVQRNSAVNVQNTSHVWCNITLSETDFD